MRTLLELITIEMKEAFVKAGYGEELARVTLSNRPDLCEYQCNGAMAGAKKYKKAPIMLISMHKPTRQIRRLFLEYEII